MFVEDAGISKRITTNYTFLRLNQLRQTRQFSSAISVGLCRTWEDNANTKYDLQALCTWYSVAFKVLSDTVSDAHWTILWKPSQPLHLHGTKLCTLLLVAKYTCQTQMLFVLLWVTVLTQRAKA